MTTKKLLLGVLLAFGLIAPLFAADGTKSDLNDDQLHRLRYAVVLINEGDYQHAAWVIEPLLSEITDPDTVTDLDHAYRGLLGGSYEQVLRARYILLGLLERRRLAPPLDGSRQIVEGTIHSIDSVGDVPIGSVAGFMTVKRPDGSLLRFKMYTYSLILICNHHGCYAGRLDQLKIGWPASAVYLTEDQGGVSPPPTPGDDGVLEVLCDNVLVRLEPED